MKNYVTVPSILSSLVSQDTLSSSTITPIFSNFYRSSFISSDACNYLRIISISAMRSSHFCSVMYSTFVVPMRLIVSVRRIVSVRLIVSYLRTVGCLVRGCDAGFVDCWPPSKISNCYIGTSSRPFYNFYDKEWKRLIFCQRSTFLNWFAQSRKSDLVKPGFPFLFKFSLKLCKLNCADIV
jgi:hypothetical protein